MHEEKLAIERAEQAVESYTTLLVDVINQATLDTTEIQSLLSPELVAAFVESRERGIQFQETILGRIGIQSQRSESVDSIGPSWHVVMLVCMDYSDIVRRHEDGTEKPAAAGTTVLQSRITVSVDKQTGSPKVLTVEDTRTTC